MRVLVVGSGGREHALVWKLAASPAVSALFCAPGNAGTAALAESVPIGAEEVAALVDWASAARLDLVVVGPEAPLAAGLADACAAAGLAIFGPSAAAAQIEASKVWAKGFMARHGIPTARFEACESLDEARRALAGFAYPVVIKADGLAGGKGVQVAASAEEAAATLRQYLVEAQLGAAGRRVVIEEFLQGEECSVFALFDGRDLVVLPPVRDYKRLLDGDRGPNTGGMGGYAPLPQADAAVMAEVRRAILEPALAGLEAEGRPYRGVLYAGLMLTADGPRVLEFNCRFGDPETQIVLPLLESDLLELLAAVPAGRLGQARPRWAAGASCGVVLASEGYPGQVRTGRPISGLAELPAGALAFHAGTARRDAGEVVTSGGRVLTVVASGPTLAEARQRAYQAVRRVSFEGCHYRTDIAAGAVAGPSSPPRRAETP